MALIRVIPIKAKYSTILNDDLNENNNHNELNNIIHRDINSINNYDKMTNDFIIDCLTTAKRVGLINYIYLCNRKFKLNANIKQSLIKKEFTLTNNNEIINFSDNIQQIMNKPGKNKYNFDPYPYFIYLDLLDNKIKRSQSVLIGKEINNYVNKFKHHYNLLPYHIYYYYYQTLHKIKCVYNGFNYYYFDNGKHIKLFKVGKALRTYENNLIYGDLTI